MSTADLIVTIDDDFVAEITLNRPAHLNTFNSAMATALNNTLHDLDEKSEVRVIVIKGAGKAFCAGIDVKGFFDKTTQQYRNWIEIMERPFMTISRISKPVIARVHGVAAADLDYGKSFEYMNEAFARLCSTEDAKEGVTAFLEKRKPDWKGC